MEATKGGFVLEREEFSSSGSLFLQPTHDLESPSTNGAKPTAEDDEDDEDCSTWLSVEDVFDFGPEFFGSTYPLHVQVAEVNASVLTTLLLKRAREIHGISFAENEVLWDTPYALILKNYMSFE